MTAKQQLAIDKQLSAWWSAVVGDSRFDRMMLILKASTFEGKPSPDQMSGVSQFIDSMAAIVNSDEPETVYAKPGLIHDLDPKPRTVQPPENKDKPAKKTKP